MNKKTILIVAALLILLFVATFFIFDKDGDGIYEEQVVTEEQATSTATSSVPGGENVLSAVKKISYEQALKIYSDKRFQFDNRCQATPTQRVLKNNIEIMLDNRAGVSRSIYIDGTRYSLTAYGFKIVKLYSNSLPYTVTIDCGTGKNSAKVVLN